MPQTISTAWLDWYNYNMDLKLLTFRSNYYDSNYGSGGHGLIDISGAPRVLMQSEIFNYNGDTSKEVISAYSITS